MAAYKSENPWVCDQTLIVILEQPDVNLGENSTF